MLVQQITAPLTDPMSEGPSTPPPASVARVAALENSVLRMGDLRRRTRSEILSLFDMSPGRKLWVLDGSIAGPLGLVVEVSDLRERSVEAWFPLSEEEVVHPLAPKGESFTLVFLVRPYVENMKLVAGQLEGAFRRQLCNKAVVAFLPRKTSACIAELARLIGPTTSGAVDIVNCMAYCFPYDSDVLCLEVKDVFREFHVHQDSSRLTTCAEAVMQLQEALGGLIPNIRAIGSAAKYMCEQLIRCRKELQHRTPPPPPSPLTLEAAALGVASLEETMTSKKTPSLISLPARNILTCSPSVKPVPPVCYSLEKLDSDPLSLDGCESPEASATSPPISSHSMEGNETPSKKIDMSSSDGEFGFGTTSVFSSLSPIVDFLVVIDRRVDVVSPLCSQFTYEGLLASHIGINHTYLDAPASIVQGKAAGGEKKTVKVPLHVTDPIYAELRDKTQPAIGPYLHQKASEIQRTYREKDDLKSIPEISDFMRKFRTTQVEHVSLSTHVALAAHLASIIKDPDYQNRLKLEDDIMGGNMGTNVLSAVEDAIEAREPVTEVYRLMCLCSVVGNGVKQKTMDTWKKAVTQMYGYEELYRMHNLEVGGLLRAPQGSSNWDKVSSALNLIVNESQASSDATPTDISYVCAGYAPLSVRLVQLLNTQPRGWRSCPDVLNLLWGPALEVHQQPMLGTESDGLLNSMSSMSEKRKQGPIVYIVMFLGGCTAAEVAAIRLLNKLHEDRRYVVVTTEMLTSSSFLDSFREPLISSSDALFDDNKDD